MSRVALALLLLVLLVPSASACSLTSSPAGPGYIWLYAVDGTLLLTIEVQDQALGADCNLYNIIGMTARHLAWRDRGRTHLLDLATMETSTVELPDKPAGDQILLTVHGFVINHSVWDGQTYNSTWTLHRWDDSDMPLALPRSWAYLQWHDGETAAVSTRPTARSNATTWIHDLGTGEMVAGPFTAPIAAGGRDWTIQRENDTLVLHRDGVGRIGAAQSRYPTRVTVDGLWTQEWDDNGTGSRVWRNGWDGTMTDSFETRGDLLHASRTHVVTGAYALAWRNDPFSHIAPAPVGLLVGLLLLVLAAARRR